MPKANTDRFSAVATALAAAAFTVAVAVAASDGSSRVCADTVGAMTAAHKQSLQTTRLRWGLSSRTRRFSKKSLVRAMTNAYARPHSAAFGRSACRSSASLRRLSLATGCRALLGGASPSRVLGIGDQRTQEIDALAVVRRGVDASTF